MVDKLIMFKNRVVIPKPLRKEVLSLLHIGHQGTTSRLARVEETLWWPNLRDDLESMRKACEECQENQPSQPKEPPKTPESPAYPFQKLHSDYFQLAGKHFLLLVEAFIRPNRLRTARGIHGKKPMRSIAQRSRCRKDLIFVKLSTSQSVAKWRTAEQPG